MFNFIKSLFVTKRINNVTKDESHYISCGLNNSYLGDWYQYDYRRDFQCNFLSRICELTDTIEKHKASQLSNELLLEWEHLAAVLHNSLVDLKISIGINSQYIDVSKIDMKFVIMKYRGAYK